MGPRSRSFKKARGMKIWKESITAYPPGGNLQMGIRLRREKLAREDLNADGRICVRRLDHLFTIRQAIGNGRGLGYTERIGQKVLAITDELVEGLEEERWEDMKTKSTRGEAR